MKLKTIKFGRYKHFKGNEYELLDIAVHTETDEDLAIYRSLSGNYMQRDKLYARPLKMFLSKVDKEKYPEVEQEYRFRYIGDEE